MVTKSCYGNENLVYRELNEREIRIMGGWVEWGACYGDSTVVIVIHNF